jgi:Cu(I)/Ag(I) efflux system periplasmic protein CusF
MIPIAPPLLLVLLLAAGSAFAQAGGHAGHHEPANLAQSGAATLAEGEIRRIDKDAGKITLKHGEIKNLDMPPMTMVFQVKDRAFLEKVKVGDKVRFAAEQNAGAYTVTSIETVK